MDTYYIDGKFVSEHDSFISVKDIIVLRGFGVFDFLITYAKRPFHLEEHVERLENSAQQLGLQIGLTNEEICAIVRETVARNPHHTESAIRILYSGGISSDGLNPEGRGILMVLVTQKPEIAPQLYSRGAKVITVDAARFMPAAKSTCYLSAVLATRAATSQGAVEALYVDRDNRILEGATTNFFCFIGERLITPRQDVLSGVTRSVITELAGKLYEVEARNVYVSEVGQMQEAFITASNKEVMPVVKIDAEQISKGCVGERVKTVMKAFRNYTDSYGLGKARLRLPGSAFGPQPPTGLGNLP
ncbi:MAG: aminotransferase class IV [Syntrophobacteraceae bacterium]